MAAKGGRGNLVRVFTPSGDLLTEARLLTSFRDRFFGLAFRNARDVTEPALLCPCRSIHTFFMRFPIDAFFLSMKGDVLKTVRNVPPNRVIFSVTDAMLVLEVPARLTKIPEVESVRIPGLIAYRC